MIGHILNNDIMVKNVIKGDVEGYIRRGRPMMEYMKQVMINIGKVRLGYKEIKELSYNREAWRTTAQPSKHLKTQKIIMLKKKKE